MKKFNNKRLLLRRLITVLVCVSITPNLIGAEKDQKKTSNTLQTKSNATVSTPSLLTQHAIAQPTTIPLATTAAAPAEQGHIWNLENADIRSVINEVSQETGKNFVIDPRVSGQVNLVSTKPLPPDALYKVFLTMLEVYGFSAIDSGNIVQIVPDLSAPQINTPLATPDHPGVGSEVVVRVIPIKYISSTQLVPILRPLLPQWSIISAYPPSNLLIASGGAANLQRIIDIIQRIDVISNNDLSVIPLKNANAGQIVKILKDLQSSTQINGGSTATVAIDEDSRTNSVILSGNEAERLRMSVIITQLDTPSTADRGHTQVVFLYYLKAKKLAPILDKILKGQSSQQNSPNTPSQSSPYGSYNSRGNGNGSDNSDSSSDDISNLTSVLPEDDDNALIINASASAMQSLKAIIQQLDVRPEQVYVQAIIVQLNESSLEKLGVQWGSFMNGGSSSTVSTSGGIVTTNSGGGLTGDFAGGTGVGVIQRGNFAALAAAIKGLSGADVLSEPSIMVQNNQKASFNVVTQVSVQNSQQGSLGGGTNSQGVPETLSTFDREDVGLKFTVTPQINHGRSVQLLISQENGTLQNPTNPGTTPLVNKSMIKTSVLVNSDDILVLGGFISNNMTTSTYKTPLLGDIPILGHLFSYTSHDLEKEDLMIFLRPVIVSTPLDGTNVTDDKYKYIRNLQLKWRYDSANIDTPNERVLPPRQFNLPLPLPFDNSK